MKLRLSLSAERLRELLRYDYETGVFAWRHRHGTRGGVNAEDVAGSHDRDGYILIGVDGRHYRAHRLVWFYVFGVWPKAEVDHINGNPSDNRFINLREASRADNSYNMRRKRSNKAGYKGVRRNGPNWQAAIKVNGKFVCLGNHQSPEAAHAAYCEAARLRFGDFARG
jgi:HNH endonuclease